MATDAPIDIYDTPAALPPPGVVPNLKHPQTLHAIFLVTGILCLLITMIAVVIRVFTKMYIMQRVRAEDCKLHDQDRDRN